MRKILSALAVLALLFSCQQENNSGDPEGNGKHYNIHGFIQKGPFVQGSTISIQSLDSVKLAPTGMTYSTITTNDLGAFSLESEITTRFVETTASGYYYNEVKGRISKSTISLRGISDLSDDGYSNVNVLTNLEAGLVRRLIKEGMSISEARKEADHRILEGVGISADDIGGFDKMDITGSSERDAILLAISVMLQADRSEGEFSEYYAKLSQEVEEGGVFHIDPYSYNGVINVSEIQQNMITRYGSCPNFEQYLDMDGDGLIDKNFLKVTITGDEKQAYDWDEGPISAVVETSCRKYKIEYTNAEDASWISWSTGDDWTDASMVEITLQPNNSGHIRQTLIRFVAADNLFEREIQIRQYPYLDQEFVITKNNYKSEDAYLPFYRIKIVGGFSHDELNTAFEISTNGNHNLTSLDLSELRTEDNIIGAREQIRDVPSLKSLILPNSAVEINGNLLENGSCSLESLTFGPSVIRLSASNNGFLGGCWVPSRDWTLPTTIKYLSGTVFYGCNFTKLTIPADLSVENGPIFQFCDIGTLIFSSSSIPGYLFKDCRFEEVIIPGTSGELFVGSHAFQSCSFTQQNSFFPEGLNSITIEDFAFERCSLPPIEIILSEITSCAISDNAFDGISTSSLRIICDDYSSAPNLRGATLVFNCADATVNIQEKKCSYLILNLASSVTALSKVLHDGLLEVNGGENVTALGSKLFAGDVLLRSFTFSNSITKIPTQCFDGCSSLVELNNVPSAGFTQIGAAAFRGTKITNATELLHNVGTIGESLFADCSEITQVQIPATLTAIPNETFMNCSGLISVSFATAPESLGAYSFSGTGIASVDGFLDGVTKIGDYAFSNCKNITSVVFPNGFSAFPSNGFFYDCSNLTHVSLTSPVGSIGQYTFKGCNLSNIGFLAKVNKVNLNSINDLKKAVLEIPEGPVAINGDYQSNYLEKVILHGSGLRSGDISLNFSGNPNLREIEITADDGEGKVGKYFNLTFDYRLKVLRMPSTYRSTVIGLKSDASDEETLLEDLYFPLQTPPKHHANDKLKIGSPRIHIPFGSLDAYESHETWKKYIGNFVEDL